MKYYKFVSILVNKDIAYLNAISSTDFIMIATEPFLKVNWVTMNSGEKYEMIMRALSSSKTGLNFPESPQEYGAFILKQFGVKSWNLMNKGSKRCEVKFDEKNRTYEFIPHRTVKGGHDGIKDGIEIISSEVNSVEFMIVFERVLSKCE